MGPSLFVLLAAWMLRGVGLGERVPGVETGEAWGRMFMTAQVSRWMDGTTPLGHADLLSWPVAQSIWPVDPLVQLVQVPLQALFGPAAALTLSLWILLSLAGWGPMHLARTLGAGRPGALAAGLAVQLSPFMMRNLHDCVLEATALGVAALAAAACVRAQHDPTGGRLAGAFLGVLCLALCSPYYVVYLALVMGLWSLWRWRHWRTSAALGGVSAAACLLALLPFLLTEGGEQGRLGPQWRGSGYQLSPSPLVDAQGQPARPPPPPRGMRGESSHGPGPDHPPDPGPASGGPGAGPPPGPPPMWQRVMHRFPGGLTLVFAGLGALVLPRTRRLGLLAVAFFALSPGPALVVRTFRWPIELGDGPLVALLQALPLTASMGNPSRSLAIWVLLAGTCAALGWGRSRWGALALGLVALGELALSLPAQAIPSTALGHDAPVLAALSGPTTVFPSGDPPAWDPAVGPKEVLAIAGAAGVPVALDYGRGAVPSDTPMQVRLADISGRPIGARARESVGLLPPDATLWSQTGFERLLVLDDRLQPEEQRRLHQWLNSTAQLQAQGTLWSLWTIPADFSPPAPETRPRPP